MNHNLIYPFGGNALCTKCGLPVKDETEKCLFGSLPDNFTGEPSSRQRRDRRDDRVFTEA